MIMSEIIMTTMMSLRLSPVPLSVVVVPTPNLVDDLDLSKSDKLLMPRTISTQGVGSATRSLISLTLLQRQDLHVLLVYPLSLVRLTAVAVTTTARFVFGLGTMLQSPSVSTETWRGGLCSLFPSRTE
jgi:hypothetical protein